MPQATTVLSGTFSYSIGGLYMSFSDVNGGNWSILFDTTDAMTPFLRAIVATVCHIRSHSPSSETKPSPVIGQLPPGQIDAADADPTAPLAAGSTAGVSFQAWEVGDINDNPSSIYQSRPFLAVLTPDICKIRFV